MSCVFLKAQEKTYPLEQCEMIIVRGIPDDEEEPCIFESELREYIDSGEQVEGTGFVIWEGEAWTEEHYMDFNGKFDGPYNAEQIKEKGWELPCE